MPRARAWSCPLGDSASEASTQPQRGGTYPRLPILMRGMTLLIGSQPRGKRVGKSVQRRTMAQSTSSRRKPHPRVAVPPPIRTMLLLADKARPHASASVSAPVSKGMLTPAGTNQRGSRSTDPNIRASLTDRAKHRLEEVAMVDGENGGKLDRELSELLQELRVALPGVQVLFAFLLTIPFAQRFTIISGGQKTAYFIAFLSTGAATALLITPSAYHRIQWRQRDKERMLRTSTSFTLLGL